MNPPQLPERTRDDNPDSAPPLDPLAVWRMVRKHWALALATALAVALAVTFYTLGEKKIYQASATVQLDPNPPRPLGKDVEMVVPMGTSGYWDNQEYYKTQYEIIKSRHVALPVVKELGLEHDAAFLRDLPAGTVTKPAKVSPASAADILRSRVKVDPIKDSRLAIVHYNDADPARAQRILSVLMRTYIDQNFEFARDSTSSAVDWLRKQLDKLRQELESSERALHEYKIHNNVLSLDPDGQSSMLQEEMKELNDELTSVRAKKQAIAAQRAELDKVKAGDPTSMPSDQLLSSPLIQDLRERYEEAIRERASLIGEGKGPDYPDVVAADARAKTARKALLKEVQNVKGAADHQLAAVTRQEAGLAKLYNEAKRRALQVNLLEVDYSRLLRRRDNNEKLYSMVLQRTKESDLARMMRVNNIRVVDAPLEPRAPIRPRVPLNVALGVLGGLVLGVGAAMGRGLLDRTIKTPDDVERELGLACLGLLPEIGDGHSGGQYYGGRGRGRRRRRDASPKNPDLIVHEFPMSGVAEAARAIRTNLLFMSPDNPYETLLVTSPAPAEGKTTVAACTAIAMAQAGKRVALVDCDLRRPRVHRIFDKGSDIGVTTAIVEGATGRSVALDTGIPNLWVVPAGPIPPNPAELFHSEKFKAFLRDLSSSFDRIIIDSPPVVTVTDAAVLSTLVDGVVLVVRAFGTAKEPARHGVRALQDVGGKTVGVVLNAVNLERHEYKYQYYYYRREGYGHEADAERRADD